VRQPGRSDHAAGDTAVNRSDRSAMWRWVLGICLIAGLVWFAGPQQLWRTLRAGSTTWLLAAALVLVPWFLLGILNVWVLLRHLTPIAFGTFAGVYAKSWISGLVLPGQLGDATQVWLLRRHGIPMSFSSAAYATDKALSLGFMLVLGATIVAAGIAVLLVSFVNRMPASRVSGAFGNVKNALAVFASEHRLLYLNFGITVLKWMLLVAAYACAFRAFGPPVPLAAVATIPAMSSLVGHIPVSVGGLGTTEWTAVGLFGRLGVPEAIVLSAYLLLRGSAALIAIALAMGRGVADR
jgi:uncharacterized membrane protein YbhN (UPF0104 family)